MYCLRRSLVAALFHLRNRIGISNRSGVNHTRFNKEPDSIISVWWQQASAQRIACRFTWPVGALSLKRASMPAELFASLGLSSARQVFSWRSTFIQQNGRSDRIIVQLPAIHQHLVAVKVSDDEIWIFRGALKGRAAFGASHLNDGLGWAMALQGVLLRTCEERWPLMSGKG